MTTVIHPTTWSQFCFFLGRTVYYRVYRNIEEFRTERCNTLLKSKVTTWFVGGRCRGSQECGSRNVNFACKFNWRWYAVFNSIQFNSIRIYFHQQQRYKVFYKVYIYIKFVVQFVRNDNYTVIYGYITCIYNELNNKRKQCILCRVNKRKYN